MFFFRYFRVSKKNLKFIPVMQACLHKQMWYGLFREISPENLAARQIQVAIIYWFGIRFPGTTETGKRDEELGI
jgi:hypothetical protein